MGIETTRILQALADDTADLSATWSDLADIIAMNCMRGFTPESRELQSELLTKNELQEVQQALVAYVQSNFHDPSVCSAIWCLGKFFDPDLKPFLVDCLLRYFRSAETSLAAMGQMEIALSNLDEDILTEGSFSYMEHEKNMSEVREYLTLLGKLGESRGEQPPERAK